MRRWWIAPIALIAVTSLSGCIVIGMREDYAHDAGSSSEQGPFVPDVYLDRSESRTFLPFLRVDLEQPPHDLVMLLYDQTYENTDRGFTSVTLDRVVVQPNDGDAQVLVSTDTPLEDREFLIATEESVLHDDAKHRFKGVVKSQQSFSVVIEGKAITTDGKSVPFQRVQQYRYNGRRWTCWSLYQELSGV